MIVICSLNSIAILAQYHDRGSKII